MDLSDELKTLQELQENGTLTPDEFAQAKKTLLARHERETEFDRDSGQLQSQLEQFRLEADLLQIDRQWKIDRKKYMIRGKGGLSVPTRIGGIRQGVIFMSTGFLGLLFSGSVSFVAFLVTIPIGLLSGIYTYLKAIDYENAYSRYEARRRQCIEHYQRRH